MTHLPSNLARPTPPRIAKWCVWSVENQVWLAGRMRIYIWGATTLVAFFALVGLISLETAFWSLLFSGILICVTLGSLIQLRRIWLLNIQEPELRQRALAAMLKYLKAVDHTIPVQPQDRPFAGNDLKRQADCNHGRQPEKDLP